MGQDTKNRRYAIYHLIPGYYNNDRGFVQKVVLDHNNVIESSALTAAEKERLELIVKSRIVRYSQKDTNFKKYHFKFVEHKLAQRTLEPDSFVCTGCRTLYSLKDLKKNYKGPITFRCIDPRCKKDLRQVTLMWIHSDCGNVQQINPRLCPDCKKSLSVQINHNDPKQSKWKCECGYDSMERHGIFSENCRVCNDSMRIVSAIKVFRPQSFSTFSSTGDWRRIVAAWSDIEVKDPLVESLPDYIKKQMEVDETLRQKILESIKREHISSGSQSSSTLLEEKLASMGIDENTSTSLIQELKEYAGLVQKVKPITLGSKDANAAQVIADKFRLELSYCDGLRIVEGVFGSLIGSSDKDQAMLRLIDGETAIEKLVFVRTFTTEGLLFQLPESTVAKWLIINGHKVSDKLRMELLGLHPNDARLELVTKLMHSISHLLIRTSEIYSGVSRETLSEILFPHSLAFVIYNTKGSELGTLRTTFEGKTLEWLWQAKRKAQNCVHDPLCAERSTPCYACMYIAERNCPMFNEQLDRDVLVSTRGDCSYGYWSKW